MSDESEKPVNIRNGERQKFEANNFTALAGVQVLDGVITLAFRATGREARTIRQAGTGRLAGVLVTVLSLRDSDYIKGMLVLEVEPIAAD